MVFDLGTSSMQLERLIAACMASFNISKMLENFCIFELILMPNNDMHQSWTQSPQNIMKGGFHSFHDQQRNIFELETYIVKNVNPRLASNIASKRPGTCVYSGLLVFCFYLLQ
jgi:hypothetical protein